MPLTRIVTDVPSNRVTFVTALIRADGGRAETMLEEDGEFTVIATYPDDTAVATAAQASVPSAAEVDRARTPWLTVAMAELGQSEGRNGASNPRIEAYHATTTLGARPDSVPWCSSFVNFCLQEAGIAGTRSAAARSWLGWGTDAADFTEGCIVVLSRGNPPKGHVGFYVGRESGRIRLLGGNQTDRVSIASFEADRVLGRRLPLA